MFIYLIHIERFDNIYKHLQLIPGELKSCGNRNLKPDSVVIPLRTVSRKRSHSCPQRSTLPQPQTPCKRHSPRPPRTVQNTIAPTSLHPSSPRRTSRYSHLIAISIRTQKNLILRRPGFRAIAVSLIANF